MNDRCPECERLRTERDEFRAFTKQQFDDLADLRRELDAMREKHAELLEQFAEIRRLADRKYRLFSATVEAEIMQRLGLTTPSRN
jgi:uncharacterized coiled-coil DUF342 family protein